jgi:maltose alpha-D-glucosyltransferase / alpha-amylase
MQLDDKKHWYKDATIYQIHIRSFKDSNADGIGDFPGLMQNLDYIEELGVTAIWVQPFFASPQRDGGYDISDYYNINPDFGTVADFREFVAEAHRRNLKVIIELVINHTSSDHPWFQRARKAPKDSPERNWYVWTDNPNQYKDVRIIFTDTEPSNWTFDDAAGQYFWHRFFSHQPDLNFDNPEVQAEIFKIIDFWAGMGVDGFRLDAIPYLFEREGTNCENLPETHDFLKKIFKYADETYPGVFMLAEANMWPEDSASYFGEGDECHMNFHFPIMPRMYLSLKTEDRYPITDILEQTPAIPEICQWGMFLRNHDELTLEMVTEEERDFMYRNYAPNPQARINVGIRRRLAPLLDNDRRRIELMNVLLHSMPGTPVLYYGDEIGMGDNFYLPDRDGVRTPMQWSATKNAGFSDAVSHRLFLPVIDSDEYNPEVVNIELQRQNPNSLFHWTKNIIATRKKFKAFGRGKIKFVSPENPRILAFVREYENEKILVVVNLSKNPQAFDLELSEFEGLIPKEIFSQNKFPRISRKPYAMTLSPYGYFWFSLEKVAPPSRPSRLPVLQIPAWASFQDYEELTQQILPHYLPQCRWFGGKAKVIQKIEVRAETQYAYRKNRWNHLLLLDVHYTEGFPETYFLPLTLVPEKQGRELMLRRPSAVVAKVSAEKGGGGMLIDLLYDEAARNEFVQFITEQQGYSENFPYPQLYRIVTSDFVWNEAADIHSRVLGVEQSNTSVILNEKYFIKLYRKLDTMLNPDIEVSRFLTEETTFSHTPKFLASLHFRLTDEEELVIGMMQALAQNRGDAWAYVGEVLARTFAENQPFQTPPDFEEKVKLLGKRTAEMHIALASQPQEPGFEPEEFSLHYQSSLYAGLYSLVRGNFQTLERQLPHLPAHVRAEAEALAQLRPAILKTFKRLNMRKLEAWKIRTHGDYHLGQVLFTGEDFRIIDFEGEPARPFSERRLKRSPLKDVAGMMRSFHYAAYAALLQNENLGIEQMKVLQVQAETWYKKTSDLYLESYRTTAGKEVFFPQNPEDFKILLETFILEKAVYELNYELVYRPGWVLIPINGIRAIMTG